MTTDIATTTHHSNGAIAHAEDKPKAVKFIDRVFEHKRDDIAAALAASRVSVDVFRLGVARAIMKEPRLESCDQASLAGAILDCARLGLVPAGYDAQAAIIVRSTKVEGPDGRDRRVDIAQLMVMVGGLVDLARREGGIKDICAETVREGEAFKYDPYSGVFAHEISFPRKAHVVAAYAWVVFADGSRSSVEVIGEDEINQARNAGSGGAAWKSWGAEMAKKVIKRRIVRSKRLLSAGALSGVGAVEGDHDDARDEAPIAESAPVAQTTRAAVLALAAETPAAAVVAEARATERDHDAAEDARLERLREAAEKQAAPKPTPREMSQLVEARRAAYAKRIRRDDETEEAARKRASAELGPVTSRTLDAWLANADLLDEVAHVELAAREEPREPGEEG